MVKWKYQSRNSYFWSKSPLVIIFFSCQMACSPGLHVRIMTCLYFLMYHFRAVNEYVKSQKEKPWDSNSILPNSVTFLPLTSVVLYFYHCGTTEVNIFLFNFDDDFSRQIDCFLVLLLHYKIFRIWEWCKEAFKDIKQWHVDSGKV